MTYATYTTEAIVCGGKASNTSDRSFLLFTRDNGMLFATARSVREEASKQRPALQDFSHLRVSLVKGKSGWRVGSAEALGNAFLESDTKSARIAVVDLVKLVRRYVHGESPLPRAYTDLVSALALVRSDGADAPVVTALFEARLLAELGYVAPATMLTPILGPDEFTVALAAFTPTLRTKMSTIADVSSNASHL